MKKIQLLIVCFCFFTSSDTSGQNIYSQKIYFDQIQDAEFGEAVKDLKHYLQVITGREFTLVQSDDHMGNGIHLAWNKKGYVDEPLYEKLKNGSIEDFILAGTSSRLLLVANHAKGFSRAIYSYLDDLGVKWYFPGSEWEYVPNKPDITIRKTEYNSPAFIQRDFFGTGSIRYMPFDKEESIAKEWNIWKRRNRMGGEINPAGHYGETFNYKYKVELEAHPEFMALVKNKRGPYSPTVKWCISNASFRKLFLDDRLDELKGQLKLKAANEKIVLSVDPADGGGDCECDQCKKLGNASDRYFFLGNEVSRAAAQISPRAYCNIYAYNTHAAPPPFSLSSNLIVQVIPYAFQDVGTPEQMLALWRKRHSTLMIYDYYAIPDWHYDEPRPYKTSPDTLVNRLKAWKKQGIKGVMLESTFSIGNAGLGLYLMSRVAWNIHIDIEKEKNEFFKNMFGTGAMLVKDYFAMLGTFYEGPASLPYLLNLVRPDKWKDDNAQLKRITALQAYTHYLVLYQKWYTSSGSAKKKAHEELMTYIWKIYPSKMIHSTRLAELFDDLFVAGSVEAKDWFMYEPYGDKIKNLIFASPVEIKNLIEKDVAENPFIKDFPYRNNIVKAYSIKQPDKNTINMPEVMFLNFPETYIRTGNDGYFHFYAKFTNATDGNRTTTMKIICTDTVSTTQVYGKAVELNHNWQKISIPLKRDKSYLLRIENVGWVQIRTTQDQWMAFRSIPTYFVAQRLWAYVPGNVKALYYTKTEGEHPVFKDGQGQEIKASLVNSLSTFQVPVKNPGWWQLESSGYKFLQFFSVPGFFFLHPNYVVNLK